MLRPPKAFPLLIRFNCKKAHPMLFFLQRFQRIARSTNRYSPRTAHPSSAHHNVSGKSMVLPQHAFLRAVQYLCKGRRRRIERFAEAQKVTVPLARPHEKEHSRVSTLYIARKTPCRAVKAGIQTLLASENAGSLLQQVGTEQRPSHRDSASKAAADCRLRCSGSCGLWLAWISGACHRCSCPLSARLRPWRSRSHTSLRRCSRRSAGSSSLLKIPRRRSHKQPCNAKGKIEWREPGPMQEREFLPP